MKNLIPRGADRAALGTWLLAAVGVAWFSIVVIRVIPHEGAWPDYLSRWNQWDADRFRWLATYGYDGGPPGTYVPDTWPAFFPGYPMAVRFVGILVSDYRAAGIVVSLIAGAIAMVALARLGDHPSTIPRTFRKNMVGGAHRAAEARTARSAVNAPVNEKVLNSSSGQHIDADSDRDPTYPPDAPDEIDLWGARHGETDDHHDSAGRHGDSYLAEHPADRYEAGRRVDRDEIGRRLDRDEVARRIDRDEAGRRIDRDEIGRRIDRNAAGRPGRGSVASVGGRGGEAAGSWRGPGFYSVLALVLSPCAVFLFAAYSEALFLALAVPAWLLAKKGRWELAVLCAAGASIVRITGLFLALGLIVEFLVGEHGRRAPGGWRNAPYLVTPFLSIGAYMAYQWHRTGDWFAWLHAQAKGWSREFVPPWESFETTWTAAFTHNNEWTNAFRTEIVAAGVGVLLVAWLIYQHQWPETVYVGVQLAALMTSTYYLSIGRATLVWFPLWIALGHLATRSGALFDPELWSRRLGVARTWVHRTAGTGSTLQFAVAAFCLLILVISVPTAGEIRLWHIVVALLALATIPGRWIYSLYLALSLPVMAAFIAAFTQGQWSG